MNFKKIKLQGEFSAYLATQPKRLMDMQTVDVYLNDGRVLKRRLVSHQVYLKAEIGEKIESDDIVDIRISPPKRKKRVKSKWDDEED